MMNIQKTYKKVIYEKQGFTLVELIVVLVILAILTTIMVPTMTGWIDKAKQKQAEVNARTLYLAAQTVFLESYSQSDWEKLDAERESSITVTCEMDDDSLSGRIASLAAIQEEYAAEIIVTEGRMLGITYISEHGQTVELGAYFEQP